MALEKDHLVYLGGLAIVFVWDVAQAIAVYENSVLLMFSSMTLMITVAGFVATLFDAGPLRATWMLFYLVPAGLLGFGGVQSNAELQNHVLSVAGVEPLPLPLDGSSRDYVNAVYSHYLSMAAPAVAWVAAYVSPLLRSLYRRAWA